MNRAIVESTPMPPRVHAGGVVERIIEKPVKPGVVSRLGMSVLGHAVFSLLTGNLGWVLAGVPFLLAALLGGIGWTVKPPKAIADKAQSVEERIEDAASKVTGKLSGKSPRLIPVVGLPGLPRGKTPEQLLAKDRARADALGLEWSEEWTHETFEVKLPIAEKAKFDTERQARDDKRRAALIERATLANFGVNPDLDLDEMEKQVKDAEAYVKADADYQLAYQRWLEAMEDYHRRVAAGPNANCPACRFPIKMRTTNGNYKAVCPRCRVAATRKLWLAMHRDPPPPKEPQPPKMNPGLLGRLGRLLK